MNKRLGLVLALPFVGAINYSPITNAVASGVNEGVTNGIAMVGAQGDMFSFLITVGVVSVVGGIAFYFINKIRSGR